ncbi:ATP-sensitive inward rectifier potassium channel 10 [Anabaena cylindrica FACHB-243]|uniref:Ion transport 2 domain protein n=1 Tax=Anabaena cylindrica (strain ATCC 27899 / PCC 7122) TaxID=272123 RepID=K9ZD50_ANACC|nr:MULTISPECIES: ion channel [Anabaena]AFZ56644.1 Ion transport 2 domain protein [Anabaena cylindrica PCC 7122]MBD2416185.1 ATP-sensitive inward rectifier potassium channel 10 [Anabaena cylindrica FACHB-243]MBY5284380.1 ATP-sensitive inward rectifier potassium channel 10 [Anabaena sp. CCAP 1446/1C]MBY5311025.1 ATP-sensitive inward rectifier potassium channel 10 [Anabaena sp. CCAP 1446/1C]MCM2408667.1 ion channel [Anabaena sp. CCAP 1446/1C]
MKFRHKKPSQKHQQPIIPRVHIQVRNGQFEIMGMGVWHSYWRDPYHLLLTIPWSGFLLLICIFYVAINTLFALAYRLGGDCIANAQPGSFLDAFFFSVQTLASIGYGAMYPTTTYANIIVTIEAMIGVVGIAVMTGLAFARFSRPTARVMFSRVAVIMSQEGLPTLLFRTANQRRNMILEAQIRLYLMRDEVNQDGGSLRKIHDLKLVRSQTPNFSLSWTIMHIIDESSPLFGMTSESLVKTQSLLMVSVSGIDETVAQVVHARHSYAANDILWNSRFVDIMHRTPDGHRYVDYNYFHDVLPVNEVIR